jgi:peptidoglycan L-alanyl-D-glutamate endopeptidase CwlK|tara:strand:- start:168 stop:584 length:417 start_codon:yes stop_codon:yes gene_type:complete
VPRFGKRSKERLNGVDSRLINVLNEVVKYFDITVIEGLRSEKRQNELLAQGKSKTKFSKHLEGKAVDIAPYPIDWKARDDFHYLGGFVLGIAAKMGVNVRWGGDWSSPSLDKDVMRGAEQRTTKDNGFDDLVHFELID